MGEEDRRRRGCNGCAPCCCRSTGLPEVWALMGQSETSKHGPNWERAGVAFGTGTTRDSEPTHPCAGCGYPLHGDPAEMIYCAVCLNRRVHIRQGWTPDA